MCRIERILQNNNALIELNEVDIENIEKIDDIDGVKHMIYVTIGLFVWFIIVSFVVHELCK